MCTTCQDELVYVLKLSPSESSLTESTDPSLQQLHLPRQIIYHIMDIYDKSLHGARITTMQHVIYDFDATSMAKRMFEEVAQREESGAEDNDQIDSERNSKSLLGNKDNAGFLYFRPGRFQANQLSSLLDAQFTHDSYLIGLLVQRWEIPWAKLFPLRLYLRLGEQFECKTSIFYIY